MKVVSLLPILHIHSIMIIIIMDHLSRMCGCGVVRIQHNDQRLAISVYISGPHNRREKSVNDTSKKLVTRVLSHLIHLVVIIFCIHLSCRDGVEEEQHIISSSAINDTAAASIRKTITTRPSC